MKICKWIRKSINLTSKFFCLFVPLAFLFHVAFSFNRSVDGPSGFDFDLCSENVRGSNPMAPDPVLGPWDSSHGFLSPTQLYPNLESRCILISSSVACDPTP